MRPMTFRRFGALALALGPLLAATACGEGGGGSATASVDIAPAAAADRLDGVCPSTVVVQLQWQPQSDMGALFEMLGPGYRVDSSDKSVTGPLVAGGKDTGVDLTLKAGGPAIGFQSVPSQMYADDSVHLGLVHSDQLIAASGTQRVVGVTPLLKYSPAMLMWDPSAHPGLTLGSLAGSGATVLVSKDQFYPDWLVAKGLVKKKQLDTGYDGNPARFVGDPEVVQQGFANSEPYTYEKETPAWGRKVGFQLLKDAGYDIYASNLTVRADRLEKLAPCLEKLVPIVQKAGAAYIGSPKAANRTIVDVVAQDSSYSPYTQGEADYSAAFLKDEGLIAEEADGSLGTYDMKRVASFVGELAPVIREKGSAVPTGLKPGDVFSDAYTDHSVGIG
ncbi:MULTISPECIES: nitrate ABC transporter substrate-binding protein [unclassified Streptomyces]|uniref:nitrate ABC transporter substrate-binding protein n=1 Tax=unclassified Streptomyces TaxID=2593676 RepID=UPI00093BE894|nr:nitrate ABC transporter substrate-binding protein [Streptomyces sp. CB02058]OKI90823.1 nitrate ABC transporter substrate-binding protein [Streptomyces sp. CB02058]